MNPAQEFHNQLTRRRFFEGAGLKVGGLALAGLMGEKGLAARSTGDVHPALPGFPHFAPKAKRLIYLHMNGAPSQLDLFDYKPQLQKHFDKELPDSVRNNQRITTMTSGQARFPRGAEQVCLQAMRRKWHVDERTGAAHAGNRGRHRDDQIGPHRRDQPRPGLHFCDDRKRGSWKAKPRFLDQLWA